MIGSNGDLILGLIAAWAVATAIFSLLALLWVTRRRSGLRDYTPPVTIFKPLKGLDEGLEENLRSFFRLDYPEFQILFGVADRDDPSIAVVERLIGEFPDRDARLVVGTPAFGLNPKVENLAAMWPHRRHATVLISDSNVRVRADLGFDLDGVHAPRGLHRGLQVGDALRLGLQVPRLVGREHS